MTAADEARAEAARRYKSSKLIEDYDGDRYVDDEWGYDECQRNAFVVGAEWRAERDAKLKAEGWNEACQGLAWCLDNGPEGYALQYLIDHNPFAASVEQRGADQ